MKELDKPISKNYFPLTLYRDDLESIERVLKDSTEVVEIEAGGFQFDSIDELTAKFSDRRVREMEIRTRRPYITIDLTPLWAKMYVGSSANNSAGLFYRLDQVLSRARRRLWPLYSFYFIWSLNIAVWVPSALRPKGISAVAFTVLAAMALAWVIWVNYVRLQRHSTIILTSRGSASFWVRKKDELLLVVVSGLLGAILGVAGTLLVRHFGK